MKNVLITGAGGAGGIGVALSLSLMKNLYNTVGVDSNPYKIHRARTDKKYLIPPPTHQTYIESIQRLIESEQIDFLHVQTTAETEAISEARYELGCKTFLPDHPTILKCMDKFVCYQIWEQNGIKVPQNIILNTAEDLQKAFDILGERIWLRYRRGTGAVGSLPTSNYKEAYAWIDQRVGWGKFLAAVCLEKRTITFESIWKNGELIVAQQRERLYWEHSNRAPSGVTGITGASLSRSDSFVTETAIRAIKLIDPNPTGSFAVDFTYDALGIPNPTEINAGRFMSTSAFFAFAGVNFSDILISCAFDEKRTLPEPKINPLPEGLIWIRGMDVEPILTDLAAIDSLVQENGLK